MIDDIIMRRHVDLHPTIKEMYENIQKQLEAEEIEVEFCDSLERATQLKFIDENIIMRFDMSVVESTCLFVLSRRSGTLNNFIEYLFYLICAEYAFTNGEYHLAQYFGVKFDKAYSILEERLSNAHRDSDWQLYLIIHAFMFAHEIGHYRYYKIEDCASTAKLLKTWMLREADYYLEQDNNGSKIVKNILNDHNFSEELFCDVTAAVVASTIATVTDISYDEKYLADIMLSQALVDVIKNVAMIFVDRTQKIDKIYTFYGNMFRAFFLYNYLGELLKKSVPENREKKEDLSKQDMFEFFSCFMDQVNALYDENLNLVVELVVNRKALETTREDRIATFDLLKKHISLFYVDGKEYDKYLG